eukprot:TRINITY_DN2845_c3_g1_i1.p1 TRINITY_DN2845_c3_g1~~TRINITY_DN2845_c3_g1_i1.p1  ORF type:complete len:279 (+),score=44.18 TRINITY_DN2845_c3_g1_i1:55-837(+)
MMFRILKVSAIGAAPFVGYAYGIKKAEEHYHEHQDLVKESAGNVVGLFTFPASLYSNKVIAYLDYHGTPYKNIPVDYFTKEQIYFSPEYKKLPIAIIKGDQVNDSAQIVKALASGKKGTFGGGGYSKTDEKAMLIIDERVAPALNMSIFSSFESVNAVAGQYGILEKIMLPMASPLLKYKTRQNHGDAADAQNLESALKDAFNTIGKNKTPIASELALFGVLKPVYCLDQVQLAVANCGRTPWFEDIRKQCEANSKVLVA